MSSSVIAQFPPNVVEHVRHRILTRCNVNTTEEADRMFLRHHGMIVRGECTLLYEQDPSPRMLDRYPEMIQDPELYRGRVYCVREKGRSYFPVRVHHIASDREMTVTYLTAMMVANNLIGLYVTGESENRHAPKRAAT